MADYRSELTISRGGPADEPEQVSYEVFSLKKLGERVPESLRSLPISLKVLLENLLRWDDGSERSRTDIESLLRWDPQARPTQEIAFTPARVLLQDFTGVPCVVDLAAMREAVAKLGGDAKRINPLQPVDLVIDHSVQVDSFGSAVAFRTNAELEFSRNRERYEFLRWGSKAFGNFSVVPPDTGIVHQVNLEYLARVVFASQTAEGTVAYPDSVVGTDSHTPMVNALGVVGWGVGGIEAEAAMLGQPISMLVPQVVGFQLTGKLQPGATATDLVLTVTQILREHGVVGRFVEFFGAGVAALSVADRATIANMCPEYGATIGFFPVDNETLNYLRLTGRSEARIALIEAYCREQGMFVTPESPAPRFTETVTLDLSTVEPSLAGPKRPQDRIPLHASKLSYRQALVNFLETDDGPLPEPAKQEWLRGNGHSALGGDGATPAPSAGATPSLSAGATSAPSAGGLDKHVPVTSPDGQNFELGHGAVVIAAITSCTNTSNPSVMLAAGLLARKAAEKGLSAKPWVKTSLAPGSKVVTDYYNLSGLTPYLEKIGFYTVGYGCTTCIGNSGPLPEHIAEAITEGDLVAAAVLSGNRNFEGRINPLVRANYLASPPLVVAYALAGNMDIDLAKDPIGTGSDGNPVMLADIWPTPEEVAECVSTSIKSEMFTKQYGNVFEGDATWKSLPVPEGDLFVWEDSSTYVKNPPYFEDMPATPQAVQDISGARVLAMLGDSVTTDHISPAGSIPLKSPAGEYLIQNGVKPGDFNSYGARRGNHEVMMRGTFANIRLRNQLAPGTEGGWTTHQPDGKLMSIYDASMQYKEEGVPLVVLAGKEYGSGSSRDWAAKGAALLGVRAVIAQSYERIHRSNLIGMGVLPLEFLPGEDRQTLGLIGGEVFDIDGIAEDLHPGKLLTVTASVATAEAGEVKSFQSLLRIDTPNELEYYRHGGILQYVLRGILSGRMSSSAAVETAPV